MITKKSLYNARYDLPICEEKKMENLFAYGTLMFEDVFHEVSGFHLFIVSGTLKGFSRRSIKGEIYPGIIADENGSIKGVVYRNVPDLAWSRLDRFEGEMYARQSVQIELVDGSYLPAAVYMVQPAFLSHLEQTDWDVDNFLRNGKARFREEYKGYRSL